MERISSARPLRVDGRSWEVTCLSVGNPHAVLFLPDIAGLDLERLGPLFEHHPLFPRRVNTEFIHVRSPESLDMRVWERGAGETRACGTGASAAAVAAMRCGLAARKVRMNLPGRPAGYRMARRQSHLHDRRGCHRL